MIISLLPLLSCGILLPGRISTTIGKMKKKDCLQLKEAKGVGFIISEDTIYRHDFLYDLILTERSPTEACTFFLGFKKDCLIESLGTPGRIDTIEGVNTNYYELNYGVYNNYKDSTAVLTLMLDEEGEYVEDSRIVISFDARSLHRIALSDIGQHSEYIDAWASVDSKDFFGNSRPLSNKQVWVGLSFVGALADKGIELPLAFIEEKIGPAHSYGEIYYPQGGFLSAEYVFDTVGYRPEQILYDIDTQLCDVVTVF